MAEAVAFLTEKNTKVPQQDETTYYQTSQVASDRYISVGSQADTSEQHICTFCIEVDSAWSSFQWAEEIRDRIIQYKTIINQDNDIYFQQFFRV